MYLNNNGSSNINKTSENCDIDKNIVGCAEKIEFLASGNSERSCKKGTPNVFVICKTDPKSIEKNRKTTT